MNYAYIRVSTGKQDLMNQKFVIEKYCQSHGIVIDEWVEETISGTKDPDKRKLGSLIHKVSKGDKIICSEISRLGRSLFVIMDLLHTFLERDVEVHTLKENMILKDDINSRVLSFAFGLAADIERALISQRTKEALAKKRADGIKLGRPAGSKNKVCKLTGKEAAIQVLLDQGHSYSKIARLLNVDRSTLTRFVQNHMTEQEKAS